MVDGAPYLGCIKWMRHETKEVEVRLRAKYCCGQVMIISRELISEGSQVQCCSPPRGTRKWYE